LNAFEGRPLTAAEGSRRKAVLGGFGWQKGKTVRLLTKAFLQSQQTDTSPLGLQQQTMVGSVSRSESRCQEISNRFNLL